MGGKERPPANNQHYRRTHEWGHCGHPSQPLSQMQPQERLYTVSCGAEQLSCEPWQCTKSWKTRNRHFKPLSFGMFCCTVKDNWGMILSSLKSNTQVFSAFMSQHQHRSCHATNAKSHLFGSPPASVICKEGKQKNGRNSRFSPTQSIVLYSWESGGKSTLLLNSASWSSQLTSLSLSFFNYKVMSITVSISHRALMRCKWNNTKPLLECMAHWKYPVNGKREFNRRGWDGQGTETWNIKRFHSLCWPHSMKSLRKQLSWTNATETK